MPACSKVDESVHQAVGNKETDQEQSERGDANSYVESQVEACGQIEQSNESFPNPITDSLAPENMNELHDAAEQQRPGDHDDHTNRHFNRQRNCNESADNQQDRETD